MSDEDALTREEVLAILKAKFKGLGDTTMRKLRKKGEFPQPRYISEKVLRWPKAEIEAWIAKRMEKKDGA